MPKTITILDERDIKQAIAMWVAKGCEAWDSSVDDFVKLEATVNMSGYIIKAEVG